MSIQNVTTTGEFESLKTSAAKLVVFFWAEWHEPSQEGGQMHDVLSTLAGKYKDVTFARVNAEEVPEVAAAFKVKVVPTSVCLSGGAVVGELAGANPPELSKLVRALNSKAVAVPAAASVFSVDGTTQALNSRLKALIATAPVMLFMKGTPEEPRCGFSRKMVSLLNEHQVPFATFNILEDEEVRQGLKVYSEWPTYPQLYLRSELQGGLDILNEMAAEGNLREQFNLTAPEDALRVEEDSLDKRLKALIEKDTVMLFMKGEPDAPRCGFSRTIVDILRSECVKFSHFDILSDEDVRQGLKTYSDWPTYPQLYSKGELVGGLDIVQEMVQDGPLKDQLESA